jgi:cytochrome d ubiquinol oxidase subunit II
MSAAVLRESILIGIGAGLTLYVLLGGADFGGGFWDLLAHGPSRERQRDLISAAIGPVWEANHVWLIFVVTALFAAFPAAFAALGVGLYLPFSLAVFGIVLRGAAFAFRAHGDRGSRWQRSWTRIFGIASLVTPVVLGMSAAAISAGRIRVHAGVVDAGIVASWTGPLSLGSGALSLAMCAYLAASYLAVEAAQRRDAGLLELFRIRAIASGAAAGTFAAVGLLAIRADAPILWDGMTRKAWPLVILSASGGVASMVSTLRRRPTHARAFAAVAVASVVAGWGIAQAPYLIVPDVTAASAAAPVPSLRAVAIGYAIGTCLLVPSLALLFRLFKASRVAPTVS